MSRSQVLERLADDCERDAFSVLDFLSPAFALNAFADTIAIDGALSNLERASRLRAAAKQLSENRQETSGRKQ